MYVYSWQIINHKLGGFRTHTHTHTCIRTQRCKQCLAAQDISSAVMAAKKRSGPTPTRTTTEQRGLACSRRSECHSQKHIDRISKQPSCHVGFCSIVDIIINEPCDERPRLARQGSDRTKFIVYESI